MRSLTKLFLIFSTSLLSAKVFAAACCGGGLALPSMIVGDEKAQVTLSYGQSKVIDDVGGDSYWRRRQSTETGESYRLDVAHVFWDRWQAGLSVPVLKRSRGGDSSSGLGDVSALAGYEYLPDWDYNPWRPKGLGFVQLVTPTGRSIAESEDWQQLDSRGRGFWALGLGTVLSKIIRQYDASLTFEAHRSFSRSYSNSISSGELRPGWGGSLGLGAGYNLSNLRFGAGLTWSYEDPVGVSSKSVGSQGSAQRFATGALSASYLFAHEWTATVSYLDQTAFGNPSNTTLSKGLSMIIQKRWLR